MADLAPGSREVRRVENVLSIIILMTAVMVILVTTSEVVKSPGNWRLFKYQERRTFLEEADGGGKA